MTLRETMARHARDTLTRLDHLGEVITYSPKTGSERQVRAVVNRLDVEPASGDARQVGRLRAIIEIPRGTTYGVEAVVPGDRVTLAMRLGGAELVARVRRIITQDEGTFALEVEA